MPRLLLRSVLFSPAAAFLAITALAQLPAGQMNPDLKTGPWTASWIAAPNDSGNEFGVYHFRRSFELTDVPERFIVHVSADNRYRLYLNGESAGAGPARGDLFNWHFESIDLAPFLRPGTNVIAAVVWNFGDLRPMSQHSHRTGFVLQGDGEAERVLDTGPEWVVAKNAGYAPVPVERDALGWVYIVVGPGERIDGERYPWGWEMPAFDDSGWVPAERVRNAVMHWGVNYGEIYGWRLVPRTIPMMEETPVRFARIRRADGVAPGPGFVEGRGARELGPNQRATILLDHGHLTTAYPRLTVSGGRGSRVTATYAEALFDDEGRKGHRDVVEGKKIRGIQDIFVPDGGDRRLFQPLWFRTYRYVELEIETGDDALTVHDYDGLFTAYPFEEQGRFEASDPSLRRIWDVGWRTARLCAAETYFDCPYYEQLQYVGDTRIQALISLYVGGDDRLVRQAIEAFDASRLASGLTQSRYPSYDAQIIPPYSLFWIVMVHDYWMHRDDPAFVEHRLTGIRGVVDWFEQHLDATGLPGPTPWWNFVDWSFPRGVPPGGADGGSSIIALQIVYAVDRAEELSRALGRVDEADRYAALADRMRDAVYRLCWDEERRLLADTPGGDSFSQHANAMGILTGVFPEGARRDVMRRILSDTTLVACTYYYRFYLDEAAREAGLANAYTERLDPWHDMLALGLTTFAEKDEPTRSDSHAWSSSPNYQFLATVCGIRPATRGFERVVIEPAPGNLTWLRGAVPHPDGEISVDFAIENGELSGRVELPAGISGVLRWGGREIHLPGGGSDVRVSPER